jgi:hypothetical protein
MTAITSDLGSGLTAPVRSWNTTTSWQGGVIPGSADDVTISGYRTTINQSAISKWLSSSPISITVASASGFPTSGYFWTGTANGEPVRINYTGVSSNTFTGCTIDTSDPNYPWDLGGQIANGQYVLSPAPIIKMTGTDSWVINSLTIQNGGFFQMDPGTRLQINAYVTIRDGWFVGRASTGTTSTVIITRPEAGGFGYFQTENYPMSFLDIDGSETRSWGTLTNSIAIGGVTATIAVNTWTFAIGDEVAIYDPGQTANRKRSYNVFRDAVNHYVGMDEGFDVAGVTGSTLYLSRRNGARGTVKTITTYGTQKILTVDKNDHASQLNFKAGDIITANNKVYTIDSVANSEYTLASYDFQRGSTLADFLTDYTYETGWAIDAYGAYFTSSSSGHGALVQKYLWRREMIVEANISQYDQYTTGTYNSNGLGLLMSYDPGTRQGAKGWYDNSKTGWWRVEDSADKINYNEHMTGEFDDYHQLSLDTAADTSAVKNGLRGQFRSGPNLWRSESRDHIMKFSVNGEQLGEKFSMNGLPGGLWGYHIVNNQTRARVKSITYKAPTQDLYITTTDNFNVGDIVYEAGAELTHAQGRKIVKIASKITDRGTHDDLAFGYRGLYSGDGYWPICLNVNGSANGSGFYILNHEQIADYWLDAGTGANPYVVIDLGTQRTFTHVGFSPRTDEMGTDPGMVSVQIWGSNDNITYTSIYGPTTDTKKYVGNGTASWANQIGYYATGSQTYRYVKFSTNGHNGTSNTTINRYLNIGVFNFASGNYTIGVNNAADFNIGDTISVICHQQAQGNYSDLFMYNTAKAGGNVDTKYYVPYTHRIVINKVGNTLYLDAPINWGFIEGGETVVKINRQFNIKGYYSKDGGTLWQKPYFVTNQGTNTPRIHWLKNVYFTDVGSSRLGASSFFRGVTLASQDYNNANIVDSCSVEGYNDSNANGFTAYTAPAIWRNNYIANVYEYRPYYMSSFQGVASFNNKIHQIYFLRNEGQTMNPYNYNEGCAMYAWTVDGFGNDNYTTGAMQREWRRNVMHGWRDIAGFYGNDTGSTGLICPINVIEYNRFYACNYIAYQIRAPHDLNFPVGSDIFCKHPGQRLTQYRNVGWTGWYSINDYGVPYGGGKDLGRASYDLTVSGYYQHTIKFAGADYLRFHSNTSDGQLAIMAIRGYCKAPVPIQVYIEFEYRQPYRHNRNQNGNWDYGKIRVGATQNGVYLPGFYQNAPLPTTDNWQKYVNTVTNFASTSGQFIVWLGRGDDSSFVDIRNARAWVITNTATNVTVINNTFDTSKYFDPSQDKRYIQPAVTTASNRFRQIKL